jgi:hypothetical protein
MSLAVVRAKIDVTVTAQEAGDFATAITKIRSAKLLLAGLPTRSRQGESEFAFEREQLWNAPIFCTRGYERFG